MHSVYPLNISSGVPSTVYLPEELCVVADVCDLLQLEGPELLGVQGWEDEGREVDR